MRRSTVALVLNKTDGVLSAKAAGRRRRRRSVFAGRFVHRFWTIDDRRRVGHTGTSIPLRRLTAARDWRRRASRSFVSAERVRSAHRAASLPRPRSLRRGCRPKPLAQTSELTATMIESAVASSADVCAASFLSAKKRGDRAYDSRALKRRCGCSLQVTATVVDVIGGRCDPASASGVSAVLCSS